MRQVLVVDDDPISRDLLSELFESEGFEVALATDGYEAIDAMRRRRPDLIVSDIVMPNLTGVRLVELLRTQGIQVPVILLTGMNALPRHLADALVRKPFTLDGLMASVGDVLKDQRHGSCPSLCQPDPISNA